MFDFSKPISWQIIVLSIVFILFSVAIGVILVNKQTKKRKANDNS